jgi:hypothetical protein
VNYFQKCHQQAAEFHSKQGMIECDKAAAHDAMAKDVACVGPAKKFHETMRDCHKACADSHSAHAQWHLDKCQECEGMDISSTRDTHGPKVLVNSFGKAVEDGVSGIAPDNPSVRLVVRAGSPSPEEITKVDGKHAHIFERPVRQ